jgi:hypothetical protein
MFQHPRPRQQPLKEISTRLEKAARAHTGAYEFGDMAMLVTLPYEISCVAE